jgi:hypothetical protein
VLGNYYSVRGSATLHGLALVVNSKAVVADDGTQLPHHARPVVPDKDCREVRSARHVVGGKWREAIALPNTTHGLYLD